MASLICLSLGSCDTAKRGVLKHQKEQLVHMVTFQLKEDLDPASVQTFVDGIRSLCEIPYLSDCFTALPADTGDPRLVSDYDLLLQMRFDSEDLLRKYAQDEFHLSVRKRIKSYLKAPPVVYDYWVSR